MAISYVDFYNFNERMPILPQINGPFDGVR